LHAGLRLNGDQVDPTSLLPPDPAKLVAAAALQRQLAEAETEGFWAATQLALALESQQQLAEDAEYLLGDRAGLTPGGFIGDLKRGAGEFLSSTGLGVDLPLSALGMAALGNPEGLKEYGQGLEGSLQFARQHPDEAVAGLLGLDQVQAQLKSGHPGEALGFGVPVLGSLLDPEGGDEADAARALARERFLELARDPAKGGQISYKSVQEAHVALDLERRGDLPGPIQRDPTGGADFTDATGQCWDVKGFHSGFPPSKGGYELGDSMSKISRSLSLRENVIVDTSQMNRQDVQGIRAAVEAKPEWGGRVLWWP
jgi:hypothetical protein